MSHRKTKLLNRFSGGPLASPLVCIISRKLTGKKLTIWLSYGVVSEILGVSPPKNKCGLRNIWNYSSHHDPISHRFLVPCLDYFIYTSIGKNKRVVFNDPYWVNLKKCRPQRLYWCFQNMRHHQPIQPQVCLILIYNLIPQMCVVLFCYHR